MKIPEGWIRIIQCTAVVLIILACMNISSTAIMTMGDFSGNGR